MKDLQYLGSATGEYIGDSNDVSVVTDAMWVTARDAALARGEDAVAVNAAYAGRYTSGSELLGLQAVGDLVTTQGNARLKQDVVKILLTERGLQPYPNYGCTLASLPGQSLSNPGLLASIADDIIVAMRYLSLAETSAVDDERLGELKSLDLEFSSNSILVTMSITTLAGTLTGLNLEI